MAWQGDRVVSAPDILSVITGHVGPLCCAHNLRVGHKLRCCLSQGRLGVHVDLLIQCMGRVAHSPGTALACGHVLLHILEGVHAP